MRRSSACGCRRSRRFAVPAPARRRLRASVGGMRSEEHTSELQSRRDLVCRLLLEKKNEVMRVAGQLVADERAADVAPLLLRLLHAGDGMDLRTIPCRDGRKLCDGGAFAFLRSPCA